MNRKTQTRTLGMLFGASELKADGAEVLVSFTGDDRFEARPLVTKESFGKGQVVRIGFDLGEHYNRCAEFMHRVLMKKVLSSLFVPDAKLSHATGTVELVELDVHGLDTLQLVNMNGAHRSTNTATEDMIPPVLDIRIDWKLKARPEKILQMPEGREVPFTWDGTRAQVEIPRLDMYEILVPEYEKAKREEKA